MPKHKKSDDEDDSEVIAEDSQNLCIQKEIIEKFDRWRERIFQILETEDRSW